MKRYDYYFNDNSSSKVSNLRGKCGTITKILKDGSFCIKGTTIHGAVVSLLIRETDNGRVIGNFEEMGGLDVVG